LFCIKINNSRFNNLKKKEEKGEKKTKEGPDKNAVDPSTILKLEKLD
jgi:hypothetical protein